MFPAPRATRAEPLRASDATPAAIFRKIEKGPITVILDDAGTHQQRFQSRSRVSALPRPYSRAAHVRYLRPKLLAGLGTVPTTIQRRVIPIRLQRKTQEERPERYRFKVCGRPSHYAKP
jgi:hypothetical protein